MGVACNNNPTTVFLIITRNQLYHFLALCDKITGLCASLYGIGSVAFKLWVAAYSFFNGLKYCICGGFVLVNAVPFISIEFLLEFKPIFDKFYENIPDFFFFSSFGWLFGELKLIDCLIIIFCINIFIICSIFFIKPDLLSYYARFGKISILVAGWGLASTYNFMYILEINMFDFLNFTKYVFSLFLFFTVIWNIIIYCLNVVYKYQVEYRYFDCNVENTVQTVSFINLVIAAVVYIFIFIFNTISHMIKVFNSYVIFIKETYNIFYNVFTFFNYQDPFYFLSKYSFFSFKELYLNLYNYVLNFSHSVSLYLHLSPLRVYREYSEILSVFNLNSFFSFGLNSVEILFNFVFIIKYILSLFILAAILLFLPNILSTEILDIEKNSAYECGFEPFFINSAGIEVHFLIVAFIFLIFDMELLFLTMKIVNSGCLGSMGTYILSLYILTIFAMLCVEFLSGALSWPTWFSFTWFDDEFWFYKFSNYKYWKTI